MQPLQGDLTANSAAAVKDHLTPVEYMALLLFTCQVQDRHQAAQMLSVAQTVKPQKLVAGPAVNLEFAAAAVVLPQVLCAGLC
jgi:hypothetical protein